MNQASSKELWQSFSKLISLAFLLAATATGPRAWACAGGEICGTCTSFFAPEVMNDEGVAPLFRTWHALYMTDMHIDDPRREAEIDTLNIAEWQRYFANKVKPATLRELVYKAPLSDIDATIFLLQGKSPTNASANAKRWHAELKAAGAAKAVKALYYLGYAKRVEPYAVRHLVKDDSWVAIEPAKPLANAELTAINALFASGNKQGEHVDDAVLARRYQLQSLRLLFYAQEFPRAISYYSQHQDTMTKIKDSVSYRILDLAAGAYYHNKTYAKANYLYSLVYGAFPPLKAAAYLAFHPQEEADWRATLALAKTPHEKAVLWQMFGIYRDGPRAMHEISKLEPKSPLLTLLMVRTVNAIELGLTGMAEASGYPDHSPKVHFDKEAFETLRSFTASGKVSDLPLWQLGLGHIDALLGDLSQANHNLDLAQASKRQDETFQLQLGLSRRISSIMHLAKLREKKPVFTVPTGATRQGLARDLNWLAANVDTEGKIHKIEETNRTAQFLDWITGRMGGDFAATGEKARGFMISGSNDPEFNANNANVSEMLAIMRSQDPFDAFIATRAKKKQELSEPLLHEMKAINFAYADKFPAAIAEIRVAGAPKLLGDPFLAHIKDCHDCDHKAAEGHTYTKSAFIERMADLQGRAKSHTSWDANAAFELATGHYNMTYFGNARAFYQVNNWSVSTNVNSKNYDMAAARRYYDQAAELSRDREFQAKAHFMAAKAERDAYYMPSYSKDNYSAISALETKPYFAGQEFKVLAKSYADTQYYKEVLKDCGFFRTYVHAR